MIDNFFYWGMDDVSREIAADIYTGIVQPQKAMFYNRQYGAGVMEYENVPNSLAAQVALRYNVVMFMARRNQVVTNGQDGPDRRAITSQSVVRVTSDPDGNVNLDILYIELGNYEKPKMISIPLGVGA